MGHRVFIGLSEVAGYFGALHRGFAEIGVASTFVDGSAHPYAYERVSRLSRLEAFLNDSAGRQAESPVSRSLLGRGVPRLRGALKLIVRLFLFVWAAVRHDTFIFGAGQTFLRTHDLLFLRLLGKRTIVVFTGSDHRPPYLSGRWMAKPLVDMADVESETRRIKRVVTAVERHGAVVVGLAASAQFHSKPLVSFLEVGIPTKIHAVASTTEPVFIGAGVRVLHSPSDPVGKGTARIREVIAVLKGKGFELDYVEIIGKPHDHVLRALSECDLVVDEIYSDTPMAVLAAEAAWFGKPTVVTGYIAPAFEGVSRPPSQFWHPDALQAAIEELVVDSDARKRLGRDAQTFVRTRWSSRQVAERFLLIADDKAPDTWMIDPMELRYVHGWGISESRLRDGLRRILNERGLGTLELNHNPGLERQIEEFVR